MVYVPIGRTFKVRMDKIPGPKVKAWWFNPRTGKATAIGEFPNTGVASLSPPSLESCWTGCWSLMTPRGTIRRLDKVNRLSRQVKCVFDGAS